MIPQAHEFVVVVVKKSNPVKRIYKETWAFLGGSEIKNLPTMQEPQEMQLQSLGWEDPWRRAQQPIPVFLPRESHG